MLLWHICVSEDIAPCSRFLVITAARQGHLLQLDIQMRIYVSFVHSLPYSFLLLAAAFFLREDVIYATKRYLHDGKAKSNLLVYAEIDILELQGFSWGVLLDGEPSQP